MMRAEDILRNMHLFAFLTALLLTPAPGAAQGPQQMPDPFIGVTDHYWVDASRPAQTELRDCHLFEVLGWGQGINDLRTVMRMSCQYLSRIGDGGADADRATRAALLAFEAAARDQMRMIDEAMRAGSVEPPSGSLPIRTGWWADSYAQDRLIQAHALDLILEP
jgi:hypothetical protein